MKHPSIQELFKYWNSRRGPDLAPDRDAIEPGGIRHILADTFILGSTAQDEYRFRLAGTRACAIFGRELRGQSFPGLWAEAGRPAMRSLLAVVADESIGIAAGVTGRTADGATLDLEMLVLPLKHRSRRDGRMLGALVPSQIPYWFGLNPVLDLTLGPLRYVGHREEIFARAALVRAEQSRPSPAETHGVVSALGYGPGGSSRRGLMIYEGGLSE